MKLSHIFMTALSFTASLGAMLRLPETARRVKPAVPATVAQQPMRPISTHIGSQKFQQSSSMHEPIAMRKDELKPMPMAHMPSIGSKAAVSESEIKNQYSVRALLTALGLSGLVAYLTTDEAKAQAAPNNLAKNYPSDKCLTEMFGGLDRVAYDSDVNYGKQFVDYKACYKKNSGLFSNPVLVNLEKEKKFLVGPKNGERTELSEETYTAHQWRKPDLVCKQTTIEEFSHYDISKGIRTWHSCNNNELRGEKASSLFDSLRIIHELQSRS